MLRIAVHNHTDRQLTIILFPLNFLRNIHRIRKLGFVSIHPGTHTLKLPRSLINMSIKLPLPKMNRKPQSRPPLMQHLLLRKPNMDSHRFLMGHIIDRLKHKTVIILVLGPPQDIVPQIIRFNLLLPLSKYNMLVKIIPQFLLFPPLDIKRPRISLSIQHTRHRRFRLYEIVLSKVMQICDNHTVIVYLLLPTQSNQRLSQVFIYLRLSVLLQHDRFVLHLKIRFNQVLQIIQDCSQRTGQVHLSSISFGSYELLKYVHPRGQSH